jgi:large subunit ribosomal protein L32
MAPCPQCHELKLQYRACPACGYYDGKKVIEKAAESK